MGAVYEVVQTSLRRSVAIKLLPPELAENLEFGSRLESEGRSIARLSHGDVVQIYGMRRIESGMPFLIMYYVSGVDQSCFVVSFGDYGANSVLARQTKRMAVIFMVLELCQYFFSG